MPINNKVKQLYDTMKAGGADVGTEQEFNDYFMAKGDQGYKNRKAVWDVFKANGADVGANYEEFAGWLGLRAANQPSQPQQKPTPTHAPNTAWSYETAKANAAQPSKPTPTNAPVDYVTDSRRTMLEGGFPTQIDQQQKQKVQQFTDQAMDSMKDEERRRNQPIVKTGTPADQTVVKSQGQWEDELTKSVDNLLDKKVADEVGMAIAKADDAFYQTLNQQSARPVMGAGQIAQIPALKQANEASSPEKALESLIGNADERFKEYFSQPETIEKIEQQANALGINPDDYINQVVLPQVKGRLASAFEQSQIAKNVPKSHLEYLLGEFGGSLGTLMKMGIMNKKQRQYEQQGAAKFAEDRGGGFWGGVEDAARMGVGLATDPLMYATGGAAGALTKAAAGTKLGGKILGDMGVKAASRFANGSVAQRIFSQMPSSIMSGGLNLGLYEGMSGVVNNYSTGEDTSLGNNAKIFLDGFANGGVTGGILGMFGSMTRGLGADIGIKSGDKGLQKVLHGTEKGLYNLGAIGVEGMGFHTADQLNNWIRGEHTDEDLGEFIQGSLDGAVMAGVLKLTSGHNLKDVGQGIARGDIGSRFGGRVMNFLSPDYNTGLKITDQDRKALSFLGDVDTVMKNIKTKEDAAGLYKQVMENPEVPFSTKQKFSAYTVGEISGSKPIWQRLDWNDGDTLLKTRDKDGNVVDVFEFKDADERNQKIQELRDERNNQVMLNQLGAYQQSLIGKLPGLKEKVLEKMGYEPDAGEDDVINQRILQSVQEGGVNEDVYLESVAEIAKEMQARGEQMEAPLLKSFAEEYNIPEKELLEVANKDYRDRTPQEQEMMRDFANRLNAEMNPPEQEHPIQSIDNGRAKADESAPDEVISAESAREVNETLLNARREYEDFLDQNGISHEEMDKMDYPERAMYAYNNFGKEAHDTVMRLWNAELEHQGFFERVREKTEEAADLMVNEMTNKGTVDGQPTEEIITIRDDGGREYTLKGGNVSFKDGRIDPDNSAGVVIALDAEGHPVSLKPSSDIVLVSSEPRNVKRSQLLENIQVDTTTKYMENGGSELDALAQLVGQKLNVKPKAEQPIEDNGNSGVEAGTAIDTGVDKAPEPAISKIPLGEKGEKLYEQAKAEDSYDDLVGELGETDAATIAQSEVADATKRLEKLQKQQLKGTTIEEKKSELAERRKAMDAEQQKIDYWNSVLQVPEERRRIAEEQAKAEEEARIEAEKAEAEHVELRKRGIEKVEPGDDILDTDAENVAEYGQTPEGRAMLLDRKMNPSVERRRKLAQMIYKDLFNGDFSEIHDIEEVISKWLGKGRALDPETFGQELGWDMGVGKDAAKVSTMFTKKKSNGGDGIEFNDFVHNVWESDENTVNGEKRFTTEEIRNALIDMFHSLRDKYDLTEHQIISRVEAAERALRGEEKEIEEQNHEQAPQVEDDGIEGIPLTEAEKAEDAQMEKDWEEAKQQSEADPDSLLPVPPPNDKEPLAFQKVERDRTVPDTKAKTREEISKVFEKANTEKDKMHRSVIGGITERQKADFAKEGIDIGDDYVHSIENSAIIHNQNQHGNQKKEEKRGQIAITESDYQLIPDILEDYNTVKMSPNKDSQGRDIIVYTKEYPDGTIYYLEEVRDRRKSLAFKTMYKKKRSGSSDGLMNNSSPLTSKTTSDNPNSPFDGKDSKNSDTNQENQQKVAKINTSDPMEAIEQAKKSWLNETEKKLRDGVIRIMKKAGIDISTDWEEGQRVISSVNNAKTQKVSPDEMKKREEKRDSEESKVIFDAAKELFGTTTDIREAGYILPDGTMLDFSGRHQMNEGSDTSFLNGRRTSDHREISSIGWSKDGNTKTGLETNMSDFIERGAIRIDNNAGSINLYMQPTEKQKTALKKLISNNDGDVQIDFGNGWDSEHYTEYENAKQSRVLSDIDKYYTDGIKPEGNIKFFRTKDGEAYGFVHKGKIYIDPRIATAETPVHEYTHLWAEAVRQTDEKKWKNIVDVLKSDKAVKSVWKKVKEEYPELKEDDAIAEEVLAQFSGKQGAERLRTEAERIEKEQGEQAAQTFVQKIKQALSDFWKSVADKFGMPYKDAESIADSILKDLLEGKNPNEGRDRHKDAQFEIISKNNPAQDDIHTWIRSADEIKTYDEALRDDYNDGEDITPDYTADMVKLAAETGKVTVYSSKPIEGGAFVTPSKMEAQNYAGQEKLYSKEVPLEDVAWIDPLQGQYAKVEEKIKEQLVGEKGASSMDEADNGERMQNKSVAEEMEKAGKSAKEIWYATGWERGKDGKWRYEIPDFREFSPSGIVEYKKKHPATMEERERFGELYTKKIDGEEGYGEPISEEELQEWAALKAKIDPTGYSKDKGKLTDFIDAPELFEAYPALKDMPVEIEDLGGEFSGMYTKDGIILLDQSNIDKAINGTFEESLMANAELKDTMVHEIQHAIQDIEGFARGDNPHRMVGGREIGDDAYDRSAGEVEARNVEKRRLMGAGTRRKKSPESTEDVRREEQHVYEGNLSEDMAAGRAVEDKDEIERLEKGPKVKVYRAMQEIDGKLYPPMAAKQGGKLVDPIELGKWEKADEHPEMADENGKFKLDKGNGKSLKAAYNPYIHTSTTMLNDQFSEAQSRPNLVVVEVEVPESELTSGYRAEKAKDAVGKLEWKAGIIQGQLSGTREVILSRWDKPVRIVPTEEVAQHIADMIKGKVEVMPTNVVTPQQRAELEKLGVKFVETDNRGFIKDGENAGKSYSSVYGKKANSSEPKPIEDPMEAIEKAAEDFRKEEKPEYRESKSSEPQPVENRGVVAAHINTLKATLGENINVVDSVDGITNEKVKQDIEGGKKVMGWYDPKTGQVSLYMPNIPNSYEAEKTVWHETVGHKGMRELLGDEGYKKYMTKLWLDDKNTELGEYVKNRIANGDIKIHDAVNEWLGEQAEKEVKNPYESSSMWQKVREAMSDGLRMAGYKMNPSIMDVKYMTWLSEQNKKGKVSDKKKQAMLDKLMGEKYDTNTYDNKLYRLPGESVDAAEYRVQSGNGNTPISNMARQAYRDGLYTKSFAWEEAHYNYMAGWKRLQEAIAQGQQIPDHMNALMQENELDSKVKAAGDVYVRDFCVPYQNAINECIAKINVDKPQEGYQDLEDYMYMKTGLQVNRQVYVRDWLRDQKAKGNDVSAKEQEWYQLKADMKQKVDNGTVTLRDYYTELDEWIRANVKKKKRVTDAQGKIHVVDVPYIPDEHDAAGLTAFAGAPDKKSYNDAQILDRVMNMENQLGRTSVNNLWAQNKRVTDFALDTEYAGGLVSKESIDAAKAQYDWYIPLRGFDETTAEDMWTYLNRFGSGTSGGALMDRKGRTSKADTPIATAFYMGEQAIRRAARNQVKMAALRFARQYTDPTDPNSLITEADVWVHNVGTEQNPDWVVEYPNIRPDATADEIAQEMANFNSQMDAYKQAGTAKKLKTVKTENIPYRFENNRNVSEHIIETKVNGEPKLLIVNDNPRAAQALNGLLKPKATKGLAAVNRFLSQAYTSWSPTFVARNAIRDVEFASSMLSVKEGWGYTNDFAKNYGALTIPGAGGTKKPRIFDLFMKYRRGTLDMNDNVERMFKEFVENGGVTGYIQENNIDKWHDEIMKGVGELNKSKVMEWKGKTWDWFWEGVEKMGESVENAARFATYMTSRQGGASHTPRTIIRAVADAKEVSVNFNRKGAGWKTSTFKNEKGGVDWNTKIAAATGQYLRDTSLFYNATVQGIMNSYKNAQKNPAGFALKFATPPAIVGALIPLFNQWVHDTFDDPEKTSDNPYADLAEYDRRGNLCIYLGNNNFFKIPLSLEHKAFYGLGDIAAGLLYDPKLRSVDKPLAVDVIHQLSTYSPVDYTDTEIGMEGPIGKVVGVLTPAFAKPFIQSHNNMSWTGRPIQKENKFNGDKIPEYQKAYEGKTTELGIDAANMWHLWWGGDDVRRAGQKENLAQKVLGEDITEAIGEYSPAKLQYMIEQGLGETGKLFYGGLSGAYKIGKDVYQGKSVKDALNMDEFNTRMIPVGKAFFAHSNEQQQFYRARTKYFRYLDKMKDVQYAESQYNKQAKDNPDIELKKQAFENERAYKQYETYKRDYKKRLDKLYKEIKEEKDAEKKKSLKMEQNMEMQDMVNALDAIE